MYLGLSPQRGCASASLGRGLARGVRNDGGVKTRTLLILAFVTGLIIVVAGVIQIFALQ